MTPEVRLRNLEDYIEKLEGQEGLKSLSAIADKYEGVNSSYLSQLRTGKRSFGEKAARKLEKQLGLPTLYFDRMQMPTSNAQAIPQAIMRSVPVLNTTQAGTWRTYFDNAIADTYEPLAGEYGQFVYGLLLEGDSMMPDFKSGDVVFIDPEIQPSPGDYVVAMCELPDGYATTFKKYRPRGYDAQGNEYFELVALNEDYGSYDSRNIKCTIIGTAVLQSKRLK